MSDAYSPLLQKLILALQCLPGVGGKSGQRMAFHLLQRDRDGASGLAATISDALERIGNCECCRMLTEERLCRYCASDRRDASLLCIVESPADVLAIEQAGIFSGRYFVLMGHLSPIDGIGPGELGMDLLEARLAAGGVGEIVIATGFTVEGDATAHVLASAARRHGIAASRIAYGVPVGGELEFTDSSTLSRAFSGRRLVDAAPSEEYGL